MMNSVYERLEGLPVPLRIAFAAGCAKRVLIIYTYISDVYHYGPQKAIDAAWNAAQGQVIPNEEAQNIDRELDASLPDLDVTGPQYTPALYAGEAAGLALDSISDPTARSADRAATYAARAVRSFDEGREEGEEEEKSWQISALNLLELWGDKPINRAMFSNILKEKPKWLSRFED